MEHHRATDCPADRPPPPCELAAPFTQRSVRRLRPFYAHSEPAVRTGAVLRLRLQTASLRSCDWQDCGGQRSRRTSGVSKNRSENETVGSTRRHSLKSRAAVEIDGSMRDDMTPETVEGRSPVRSARSVVDNRWARTNLVRPRPSQNRAGRDSWSSTITRHRPAVGGCLGAPTDRSAPRKTSAPRSRRSSHAASALAWRAFFGVPQRPVKSAPPKRPAADRHAPSGTAAPSTQRVPGSRSR